jgi:hypothetical protein
MLFSLSWDIHLLLPLDIVPNSLVLVPSDFLVTLIYTSTWLLVLMSLALNWEFHHWLPGSQDIEFGLNYLTSFLSSPDFGWNIVRLSASVVV